VRELYTAGVGMTVRAEMLPRAENYVEIDHRASLMRGGCPSSTMHVEHSDNERAMARDSEDTSREILEAAGVQITYSGGQLTVPGRIIHELGTARMGSDRKTSCTNKYNQLHDVNNVFVTDGAAFVSCANQNPTLTILALTMRACDYIADEPAARQSLKSSRLHTKLK
jgi:choline dehydrogenase-like flavoprotein